MNQRKFTLFKRHSFFPAVFLELLGHKKHKNVLFFLLAIGHLELGQKQHSINKWVYFLYMYSRVQLHNYIGGGFLTHSVHAHITEWSKKADTRFIFAVTSANEHRCQSFFHCYNKKIMYYA